MSTQFDRELATTLAALRNFSRTLEERGEWPQPAWELLRESGVLRWSIPTEHGGAPVDEQTQQLGYLQLASACLTTTFILTQRNAAVARILLSNNAELKESLLTELAADRMFATVGISHLTTSRQHWKTPAVRADPVDGGWRLAGEIPWVTSAARADIIVTGGVQPDGQQILIALETTSQGVEIQAPPRLLALNESETATVRLNDVRVATDRLLLGPEERVLKTGGAGGVTTSSLALGATEQTLQLLRSEVEARPNLEPIWQGLHRQLERLRQRLSQLLESPDTVTPADLEELRERSNSLVLNSAQAYLSSSKGAGFLASHPTSRALREAQFFQVWSCPQAVLDSALQAFACAANNNG